VLNAKQHSVRPRFVAQAAGWARHRRHQHGRPRRRHHPGRQSRGPGRTRGGRTGPRPTSTDEGAGPPSSSDWRRSSRRRCTPRATRCARFGGPLRARAPSATKPADRTTSSVPVGPTRATPVRAGSSCPSRTNLMPAVRHGAMTGDGAGASRRRADRGEDVTKPSSGPRTPSRVATPNRARPRLNTRGPMNEQRKVIYAGAMQVIEGGPARRTPRAARETMTAVVPLLPERLPRGVDCPVC